jgi:hypothetical protein
VEKQSLGSGSANGKRALCYNCNVVAVMVLMFFNKGVGFGMKCLIWRSNLERLSLSSSSARSSGFCASINCSCLCRRDGL